MTEQNERNEIIAESGAPKDTRVEVVGVKFKETGKVYYFAPGGFCVSEGDHVIVETARGIEFGDVVIANRLVEEKETVQPLRSIMRIATPEDCVTREVNVKREKEAFSVCQQKIKDHKLEMKLVDVEYTFDNSKLLFYFTADGRVDFRELVKDLASVFRTRIELRQIGIRDEAKMMGGLGVCGRPFCCSSFLSDFVQVSIKMAKEQSLSLNSANISGACGRLMCCLRYEHDTYEAQLKKMPPVDSRVQTADGVAIVTEVIPLEEKMKVLIPGRDNTMVTKTISLADVRSIVSYPASKKDRAKKAETAEDPAN